MFIDPAKYFVKAIEEDLLKNNLLTDSNEKGSDEFFVSDSAQSFVDNAKMFYNAKNVVLTNIFD